MGIPCDVYKDLFPSFVDGLTSETTNALIRAHVQNCPSCKAVLDGMCAPDGTERETDASREIDYLKKQKRRTRRIVLGIVFGALLLFAALLFVNVFVIGSPVTDGAFCKVGVDGRHVTVDVTELGSAGVISAVRFAEKDGVVTVKMRRVLVGILPGTKHAEYDAQNEIFEVRFNDAALWRAGKEGFVFPQVLRDAVEKHRNEEGVYAVLFIDAVDTWDEAAAMIGAPAWNPLEREAWLEREYSINDDVSSNEGERSYALVSCVAERDEIISATANAFYSGDGARIKFFAEIDRPDRTNAAFETDPEARWRAIADEARPLGETGTVYICRMPSRETAEDGGEPPTGEKTEINAAFFRGNIIYGFAVYGDDADSAEHALDRLIRCIADAD